VLPLSSVPRIIERALGAPSFCSRCSRRGNDALYKISRSEILCFNPRSRTGSDRRFLNACRASGFAGFSAKRLSFAGSPIQLSKSTFINLSILRQISMARTPPPQICIELPVIKQKKTEKPKWQLGVRTGFQTIRGPSGSTDFLAPTCSILRFQFAPRK
jgi:hypothetical protein